MKKRQLQLQERHFFIFILILLTSRYGSFFNKSNMLLDMGQKRA